MNGYADSTVDYVNRTRNLRIEQDKLFAQFEMEKLISSIRLPDKTLVMMAEEINEGSQAPIPTSYFREIVYNTEHTIHHLALIKAALIEMNIHAVNEEFGMAYSTLKYRASFA